MATPALHTVDFSIPLTSKELDKLADYLYRDLVLLESVRWGKSDPRLGGLILDPFNLTDPDPLRKIKSLGVKREKTDSVFTHTVKLFNEQVNRLYKDRKDYRKVIYEGDRTINTLRSFLKSIGVESIHPLIDEKGKISLGKIKKFQANKILPPEILSKLNNIEEDINHVISVNKLYHEYIKGKFNDDAIIGFKSRFEEGKYLKNKITNIKPPASGGPNDYISPFEYFALNYLKDFSDVEMAEGMVSPNTNRKLKYYNSFLRRGAWADIDDYLNNLFAPVSREYARPIVHIGGDSADLNVQLTVRRKKNRKVDGIINIILSSEKEYENAKKSAMNHIKSIEGNLRAKLDELTHVSVIHTDLANMIVKDFMEDERKKAASYYRKLEEIATGATPLFTPYDLEMISKEAKVPLSAVEIILSGQKYKLKDLNYSTEKVVKVIELANKRMFKKPEWKWALHEYIKPMPFAEEAPIKVKTKPLRKQPIKMPHGWGKLTKAEEYALKRVDKVGDRGLEILRDKLKYRIKTSLKGKPLEAEKRLHTLLRSYPIEQRKVIEELIDSLRVKSNSRARDSLRTVLLNTYKILDETTEANKLRDVIATTYTVFKKPVELAPKAVSTALDVITITKPQKTLMDRFFYRTVVYEKAKDAILSLPMAILRKSPVSLETLAIAYGVGMVILLPFKVKSFMATATTTVARVGAALDSLAQLTNTLVKATSNSFRHLLNETLFDSLPAGLKHITEKFFKGFENIKVRLSKMVEGYNIGLEFFQEVFSQMKTRVIRVDKTKALAETALAREREERREKDIERLKGVVEMIEHVSTLDSRTTLLCISRDGLRWTLPKYEPVGHDKSYARPPLHFRCRSTIAPILAHPHKLDKFGKPIYDKYPEVRASIMGPQT